MTTAIEEARKMAAAQYVGRALAQRIGRGEADNHPLVAAFLAAIELGERREREAVVGWQPIGTAPRDGTEVFGFYLGRRIIMKWANFFGEQGEGCEWQGVGIVWHDRRGSITALRDGLGHGGPTHWRPLPEPPERGDHHPAAVEAVEQKERM